MGCRSQGFDSKYVDRQMFVNSARDKLIRTVSAMDDLGGLFVARSWLVIRYTWLLVMI